MPISDWQGPNIGDPIPVVVVDDEAMIRQGLSLLLGRHPDMDVVAQFADGSGLLAFLGVAAQQTQHATSEPPTVEWPRSRPPVILLDLAMPDVDGFAVLAALEHLPQQDRPPVLVLTAHGGDPSVHRALDMGAHGYILKGGTADQLAHAVRAVAGGLTALSPDAVRQHRPTPPAPATTRLTPRELEVLDLLGEGLSNRTIARRLGVSEHTVKIHVSAVLAKLGVESHTQAALHVHGQTCPCLLTECPTAFKVRTSGWACGVEGEHGLVLGGWWLPVVVFGGSVSTSVRMAALPLSLAGVREGRAQVRRHPSGHGRGGRSRGRAAACCW